jgi:hypothetical protein
MDIDVDTLIINDADRRRLYEIYEKHSFTMQTFFQCIVLDDADYAYPKAVFQEIAALDLNDNERKIANRHLAGFTCIYLIRDHDTGYTKIGRSDDPERRMKQITRQDTLLPRPNNFSMLRAWDDYPYMEKLLHKEFADKRKRGEWFELSDEDIKRLQELCDIYD